jgi:hypothetical protein
MKKISRVLKAGALLAACCVMSLPVSARADVMEKIPSDALIVEKINHLDQVNAKLSDFLQQLGLTDMVPAMKNPMQALTDQLGIGPGIDMSKDAAIVLCNGPMDDRKPPLLMLFPVSDYKAFVGSLETVRTEGDATVVHFKHEHEDTYVADWGGYAAVSTKAEYVNGKHDGLKVTGASVKQLADSDLCLYVNFPALKTLLRPQLEKGSGALMELLNSNAGDMDAGKKKLIEVAGKQVIGMADRFLQDAEGTTVAINFGKNGITATMVVDFTPGSYLGSIVSNLKTTDGPLLAGLPKLASDNYMFFGGGVQNPEAMTKVIADVMKPVIDQLDTMGADGAKIKSVVESYKTMFTSFDGATFGVIAPTAALGQGSLLRIVGTYSGDAQVMKDASVKGAKDQAEMMAVFGGGDNNPMSLMKTTVTPNAKTIADVKFDKVQSEIDPNNTSMAATQAANFLTQVYGPEGAVVLEGVADPKTMILSMGNDDEFIAKVIAAAKGHQDELTADVKMIDAELPKKRFAVGYIAVDQFVTTVLSYMRANGMAVPIQLPANLPPIGFNMGTDGSALRVDVFVPITLTQSLVQAGIQGYMHFAQHGGGM